MSTRRTTITLWISLAATLPIPYQLSGVEVAPFLRLLFLTMITLTLRLTEGSGGPLWDTFLALGAVQVVLYALLLLWVSWVLAALLQRILSDSARRPAVVLIVATLFAASVLPIYTTPISSTALYSNILQILD